MKRLLVACSALAAMAGSSAATLDFNGDICSSNADGSGAMEACINGKHIHQSYGDAAGVDVSFSSGVGTDSMLWWSTGYSSLVNVAYGDVLGAPSTITLAALPGHTVTLEGFALGSWLGLALSTSVVVSDLAGGAPIFSSGVFTTSGPAVDNFPIAASSAAGFEIRFGPDAYFVAIDHVNYSVSPVPEASTWALMAAGLGGMGLLMRRRRPGRRR